MSLMLDKDIDICISFLVLWSCVQSYFHFKSMAGYLVLKRALSISDPFSGWKKILPIFGTQLLNCILRPILYLVSHLRQNHNGSPNQSTISVCHHLESVKIKARHKGNPLSNCFTTILVGIHSKLQGCV